MSLNVGFATLGVIPSVKGMRSELDRQTRGDFSAVGAKRGREFGNAAGKEAASGFKAKFGNVGRELAAPIGGVLAGAGIIEFFKGAIEGASDLAETTSKVNVIFGDATRAVEAFAGDSKRNILLTKQAALDASATFGVFGKSAGLTGRGLSDFATKLTGLASDLASFSNTTTDQAIEAIGAALRGESEPIRAYGVLLDDASLRQEAFRLGIITTTKNALTPQQRVLAAYNLILAQTKDAQGDAARTLGGFANSSRKLKTELTELQTEAGQKLLPALVKTVHFLSEDGVPAIAQAGSTASDAARAFGTLPAPVKETVAALVALKVASAIGVTGKLAAGAERTKAAYAGAATGVGNFRAAFDNARSSVFVFGRAEGEVVGQTGRLAASLAGVRAASVGLGVGLKGALGIVGGPWGAAFIAGTLALTHFWQEHQRAKQQVEDLTAALNDENGALTDQNKKLVFNALQKSGAIDDAKKLGLSLKVVTDAALGNADAYKLIENQLIGANAASVAYAQQNHRGTFADFERGKSVANLLESIKGQNKAVDEAVQKWKDANEAVGDGTTTTATASTTMGDYAKKINDAKDAVFKLLSVENQRRAARLKDRQDAVALQQSLADARKEAGKGKDTLNITSQAGRDNMNALLDLANQWNSTSSVIQNKKGAFDTFRKQFVDIATAMGASKSEAKQLADQLLQVPKKTPAEITTPGMKGALADLRALNEQLRSARLGARVVVSAQAANNRAALNDLRGTTGSPSASRSSSRVTNNTTNVHIDKVVTPDAATFLAQQNARNRRAAMSGVDQ